MRELLIGCGNRRERWLKSPHWPDKWDDLVTLDIDPTCGPDVVHDLNVTPYPFADGEFQNIWASEVLEHFGQQGDWRGWFRQWSEFYRIMQPGGHFVASCPRMDSRWAWGDPGHTRIVSPEALTFLDQSQYERQVGVSSMTDYRHCWQGDFRLVHEEDAGESFHFVLQRV